MTTSLNDRDFLRRFEDRTLPFEQWTHRAHVKVGYLYLRDHTFESAVDKMRSGIQAYNQAHIERVEVGYHETITMAFLRLIAAALAAARTGNRGTLDADEFCDAHDELLDSQALMKYYTRERLLSEEAKRDYLPPDRAPLPGPA